MAYDEATAAKVRRRLASRNDVREIKMFGGLCFMVGGHMCCGVLGDGIVFRVSPERWEKALADGRAKPFDFTGKVMRGIAVVDRGRHTDARAFGRWLKWPLEFVASLPPKKPKKRKGPVPRPRRRLS